MNRTTPLPLTGGRPQPLARLQDCLIGAECTFHGLDHHPMIKDI